MSGGGRSKNFIVKIKIEAGSISSRKMMGCGGIFERGTSLLRLKIANTINTKKNTAGIISGVIIRNKSGLIKI